MTSSAEQAATRTRRAFARLTEHAIVLLRQGGGAEAAADGERERWPLLLRATLHHGGAAYPVRVLDLSLDGLQLATPRDLPESALGAVARIELRDLGDLTVRLLTPNTSGFETVLVDPDETALARIGAELSRLRTRYWPYVERVRGVAAEVSDRLQAAIATGVVCEGDLFDDRYVALGDADPAEYRTRSSDALEGLLKQRLEDELAAAPHPEFCILQDRNAFIAVHNRRYAEPRRGRDAAWNFRHSRIRRIADERAALMASRSLRPHLVQSYVRTMGDGVDAATRMEFDAPVYVGGRHWGAVRMAFSAGDG